MSLITPLLNRCSSRPSVPLAIVGSPGHGKTSMVESWAKANNRPMVKLLASSLDETDVAGIVIHEDGCAKTVSPEWYHKLGENGVLFLDELNTARQEVQDTLLTLVCSRHLPNGDKLGDGVMIIAAMNDAIQCNNYELSPAMKSRFMWVKLRNTINSWVAWLCGNQIDEDDDNQYKAPTGYVSFSEWCQQFRSDPNFERDKKDILSEAVKLGVEFTADDDFEESEHATTPRTLANMLYWCRDAKDVLNFCEAFIDKKDAEIIKTIPVTALNTAANSLFESTRTLTDVDEEEAAYKESQTNIFGDINAEVTAETA